MKPTPTKEIKLNQKLVETVTALDLEIKQLQAQIKVKSDSFSSLISGVCLNEGLDFAKEGVYFSDDYKIVYVYNLPVDESAVQAEEIPGESKKQKAKRAKLN